MYNEFGYKLYHMHMIDKMMQRNGGRYYDL